MSTEDATLSRAEKKAQRDAARHKKTNKKRTIAEVGGDDEPVAQQDDEGAAANAVADANSEVIASSKKSKKAKETRPRAGSDAKIPGESRSERRERKSLDGTTVAATDDTATSGTLSTAKTSSKRRKKNDGTSTTDGAATTDADASTTDPTTKPSKSRFILFIGNLPFKATDAGLQAHFAKLSPFTLRHRTDPQTKRSKGFAFLEFENYDRMKTCLKLYHHSEFDADAVSNGGTGKSTNARNTRKINVELTAGGGGSKAEGRKEKIKAKNTRLEEQRKRRAEVERKEKERKEKKEGGAAAEKGKAGAKVETQPVEKEAEPQVDLSGMHPSRMARLNG